MKNAHHIHICNPIVIVPYINIMVPEFSGMAAPYIAFVSPVGKQGRCCPYLPATNAAAQIMILGGLSKDTQLAGGRESSWPPYSVPRAQFCCPGVLKYLSWFSFSSFPP